LTRRAVGSILSHLFKEHPVHLAANIKRYTPAGQFWSPVMRATAASFTETNI
jgi:hypothetical protein